MGLSNQKYPMLLGVAALFTTILGLVQSVIGDYAMPGLAVKLAAFILALICLRRIVSPVRPRQFEGVSPVYPFWVAAGATALAAAAVPLLSCHLYSRPFPCFAPSCASRIVPPPEWPIPAKDNTAAPLANPLPDSFEALTLAQNEELFSRVQVAIEVVDDPSGATSHFPFTLIYVHGPAGAGKSYLRTLVKTQAKLGPHGEKVEVHLTELRRQSVAEPSPGETFRLKNTPFPKLSDLKFNIYSGNAAESYTINELPAPLELSGDLSDMFLFRGPEDGKSTLVWLVDDLDEVHVDFATHLLELLNRSGTSGKPFSDLGWKKVCVIAFGRPEAFANNLSGPNKASNLKGNRLYVHKVADLRITTMKQMTHFVENWNQFVRPADILPLTNEEVAALSGRILNVLQAKPHLREAFGQLDLANTMCQLFANSRAEASEPQDIERKIVDYLLFRAEQKHGRPHDANDSYLLTLRKFAADRCQSGMTDGTFEVEYADQCSTVRRTGGTEFGMELYGTVPVRNLLDRSGLIDFNPASNNHRAYHFSPRFVQRVLTESYNESVCPQYARHGLGMLRRRKFDQLAQTALPLAVFVCMVAWAWIERCKGWVRAPIVASQLQTEQTESLTALKDVR